MTHPFGNQVTLVTGVGGGLGRALALEMARHGAVIAGVDLAPEGLETLLTELKARNGVGAWEIADVTDRAAVQEAVAKFGKRLGPIEILIANAGIGIQMPAESFRAEDLEKQVRVNLFGVANCIEAVLPGMFERRRGQLVAISSLASYRGVPRMAGYCASKAGVNALMDSLRPELKPRGIHCTTICPGWIRTPLTENLDVPMQGLMEADVAARLIVKAIRTRRPFYAFPSRIRLPLALVRWLPARLGDLVINALAPRRREPS